MFRKSQSPLKVEKPSAHVVMMEGKNYSTWKVQLKMLLIKDEMFGIVNGTEVASAERTTADLVKFNARKDRARNNCSKYRAKIALNYWRSYC